MTQQEFSRRFTFTENRSYINPNSGEIRIIHPVDKTEEVEIEVANAINVSKGISASKINRLDSEIYKKMYCGSKEFKYELPGLPTQADGPQLPI